LSKRELNITEIRCALRSKPYNIKFGNVRLLRSLMEMVLEGNLAIVVNCRRGKIYARI